MNDYYIDEKKFDPELLRQLGRIDIISKVIVDGLKQGGRKSRRKGFSSEFSDYKPYVEGDDLRLLDWRLYARTEKLYVKRFEAETSLEILLLMDATASMAWRWEDSISKLEYSANLMAAIAGIHIQQQDQVGLLVYDADDMHHLPPRARNTQLDLIFSVLAGLKPGAADSFEILVNSLNEMKHHRGRIIICTDLEEDEEKIEAAFAELAGLEDEIILFHVLDKHEVELPFENITHLEDSETGELLPVNIVELKKEHKVNIENFRQYWEERCKDWNILYIPIDTGMNYASVIFQMNEHSLQLK